MPCYTANTKTSLTISPHSATRGNTSYPHNMVGKNEKTMERLREHCKNMGKKKIDRLQTPEEIKYNDYLHVTGMTSACPTTIPSVNVKIYPTLLPKREIERIRESSKYLSPEERLKRKARLEEEAKRAKIESDKRKALFKKIDDEHQKDKKNRDNNGDGKENFDEVEKSKTTDRIFMFKQEQKEEIKKLNRIILNAKCSAIIEVQMQQKAALNKELRNEKIKLEEQMLDVDKKYIENDKKQLDQIKQNQHIYAEAIKKQLEEKERTKLLEMQRQQEELKIKSAIFGTLVRDGDLEKKLKKERCDKIRKELDKVHENSKMYKKFQLEQAKKDEINVQQYLHQREERDHKQQLERKIAKEAAEIIKQKFLEMKQKSLLSQSNQLEFALRRDEENKEREYRQKEKEKLAKKRELERDFAKYRNDQINEKKRRQASIMARNKEDFKNMLQKLKEDEEKVQQMEEKRFKMKKKYREDIIQQMNLKEIERREKFKKTQNEYNVWKEKQEDRARNIKIAIGAKLKALKESNLPEKCINDVENKVLHSALNSI